MKKTSKIISFILALILFITSISSFVITYAEYDPYSLTEGKVANSNIKFTFNEQSKILTLYGKGAIDDNCYDVLEFFECGVFYIYTWKDDVEKIIIKEGITNIPYNTFYGLINAKSINIPKSVTMISSQGFLNCSNLKDVYYSGTITQWNKIDFQNNNRKAVFVHDYTESIDGHDFYATTHIMGSKVGFTTENKKSYYLTKNHEVLYGLQKINGKSYIFNKKTGSMLKGMGILDGDYYIASKKDGHLLYGIVRCDNKHYITNKKTGKILYGYVQCNGKKYITNTSNGQILYGKVKYKNKYYIASKKDGHLFINTKVKCDGKIYYTDSKGAVLSKS